jgi:predicted chitinase
MTTNQDYLRAAMDAQGVTDNATRAGLAAICMGESDMLGWAEHGYANTSNTRIREVFGNRVPADDGELDALKAKGDPAFFEYVYGYQTQTGARLGNIQPGDGFKFRGRYGIQITGRGNYTRCARKIGHPELIDTPDLGITDPALGMAMCCAYIADRYKGGGFDQMVASVGRNTPDILATKRAYYAQFSASGEFNIAAPSPPPAPVNLTAAVTAFGIAAGRLQGGLRDAGLYKGAIDGDWGPQSRAALAAYQARQR